MCIYADRHISIYLCIYVHTHAHTHIYPRDDAQSLLVLTEQPLGMRQMVQAHLYMYEYMSIHVCIYEYTHTQLTYTCMYI